MAIDWNVGWVHPTSGSSGNDGRSQQTPKASIEQAYSAGFRVINVGAGTHTVSSLGAEVCLIFHPGTHTFSNAPVTSDDPLVLRGLNPVNSRTSSAGSAYITTTGSPASVFKIGRSPNFPGYPRGGWIGDLYWNMNKVTTAAVHTVNLNYCTFERNVFATTAGTWRSVPGIYAFSTQTDGDASWNRYFSNHSLGCPFFHAEGTHNHNRDVLAYNTGVGNGTTGTTYYLDFNNRSQGLSIHDNRFEDLSSGTAAIRVVNPDSLQLFGNTFKNIGTTNNIAVYLDNPATSLAIHSRGTTATDGELRLVNVTGDGNTTYSGAYNYQDGQNNRIIVMDRY